MNILIFGKTGQIGSALIEKFEDLGNYKFYTQSYSSSDVNFSETKKLEKFLNKLTVKPEIIINAAAYTNVDQAEDQKELAKKINHQAPEIIANYCKKIGAILMHYSTDYVFDGSGSDPFFPDNTENLRPLNHYGQTKLDGEIAIINSNCHYIIIRICWIYSKKPEHKNFYNTIKKLAQEKEILDIVDDQIGSPTNSHFVALNTIKIINQINQKDFSSKIIHFSPEEYISWYDFAKQIVNELRESGINVRVKKINPIKTSDYNFKAKRPLNSRLRNI